MESKNPAYRKNTFSFAAEDLAQGTMTMSGAINKAGFLVVILMIGAAIGWNLENMAIGLVGMLVGLVSSLVVIFNRRSAPIMAPIYAACDGIFIGTISVLYERTFPGVAANAMTLTFASLALMLGLYRMGILRATPRFTRVIVMATGAIAVTYLVNLIMGFFGMPMAMIHEASPMGIVFSVVVTGVACLNLIMDFALFEQNAENSPRYMEWYCGFSLLVTLVWIYIEMLRLLTKLSRR